LRKKEPKSPETILVSGLLGEDERGRTAECLNGIQTLSQACRLHAAVKRAGEMHF